MRRKAGKNGFVLIMSLLVVMVIIAMLYMIDLSAMFGPTDKTAIYAERPWFEEQRLLAEKDFPVIQTGKKGKVVINNETTFAGTVHRKDENRGDIEITIDPNGKAYGHWNCAYQYTNSSYNITADFTGNIDPTKTYQDPNGKNKQLLYFITKGKYEQIKTDTGTGSKWTTKEIIYVVGWIKKDYSAAGKLFLMAENDEESHGNAEYEWQTK